MQQICAEKQELQAAAAETKRSDMAVDKLIETSIALRETQQRVANDQEELRKLREQVMNFILKHEFDCNRQLDSSL